MASSVFDFAELTNRTRLGDRSLRHKPDVSCSEYPTPRWVLTAGTRRHVLWDTSLQRHGGFRGDFHGSGQTSQSLLPTLHFLEETHLGRTWWGCSLRTRSKQTLIILSRWKPHGSFGQENTSLSKTEMSTLQIHNMLYATEIWENCTPVVGLDGSNSIRFSKMCRLARSNYN